MASPVFNNISDDLKALITPLKSGETATYRVIQKGQYAVQEMPDGRTVNTLLAPPRVIFAAQATIYDPYKGENVEIMASAGSRRTKDGLEPVEDEIEFKGGQLVVRHTQPELYRFMELNPANKDCVIPGNQPVKGHQFERVLPAKSAKNEAVALELGVKAQAELATYSHDELKRVALRLRQDATLDRDSLYINLTKLAQVDGERVYHAIGDRAVEVESLVGTAIALGVIEWVGEERLYKLRESRATFMPIPHGDNPEEVLVVEMMEPRYLKQRNMLERLVADKQKGAKKK